MMMTSGVVVPVDPDGGFPTPMPTSNRPIFDLPGEEARPFSSVKIPAVEPENDLEKLARLIRGNDRMAAELRSIAARLESAQEYLAKPGCNLPLGVAYFDRLRTRRSAVRAILRFNRLEARALLG